MTTLINEQHAERIAVVIKRYWADRGYAVNLTVARVRGVRPTPEGIPIAINSDMRNGLPRDYRGDYTDIRPKR